MDVHKRRLLALLLLLLALMSLCLLFGWEKVEIRADIRILQEDTNAAADTAELLIRGKQRLFSNGHFRGEISITPDHDSAYAFSCDIVSGAYEENDDYWSLSFGYIDSGSPGVLTLFCKKNLHELSISGNLYPRVTAAVLS